MDAETCLNLLKDLEWRSMIPDENKERDPTKPNGVNKLRQYSIFDSLSKEDVCKIISECSLEIKSDSLQSEGKILLSGKPNHNNIICKEMDHRMTILDRAKGCLCGLAIADAVGAPLEFLSVVSTDKIPISNGEDIIKKDISTPESDDMTKASLFSCLNIKTKSKCTNDVKEFNDMHFAKLMEGIENDSTGNQYQNIPTILQYRYKVNN